MLLARGLTNRQIAYELVIAEGTAGVHVDHILNKLGFRSRAQVEAWTVEHGHSKFWFSSKSRDTSAALEFRIGVSRAG